MSNKKAKRRCEGVKAGIWRGLLTIVMLFCCIGCATVWSHPTKGETEFYEDKSNCAALAGQAAGHYDPYAIIWRGVYRDCMRGKGWILIPKR
jgi:hypothetical protein